MNKRKTRFVYHVDKMVPVGVTKEIWMLVSSIFPDVQLTNDFISLNQFENEIVKVVDDSNMILAYSFL